MRVLPLGVVLGLLTGCRVTGTFECGLDDACRSDDEVGVCEATGYCSFTDTTCTSGRRYADSAGDGFASQCVDAATLPCHDQWQTGAIRFGAVADLGVNTAMDERDLWISKAQDRIMFSSNRTGAANFDIFSASRADTTMPFGAATPVAQLNSNFIDGRVSLSTDELTLYLISNRNGSNGGADVWRATRTTRAGTFSVPDHSTVDSVSTNGDEFDVQLSADGLKLYLGLGAGATQRLALAVRPSISVAFSAPAVITELDSGTGNGDVSVSDDELIMVFTSLRPAAQPGANLWYTTRASTAEPWTAPRLVPDVNLDGEEGDPVLSADACTLFFSRKLAGMAAYDLVYAGVMR